MEIINNEKINKLNLDFDKWLANFNIFNDTTVEEFINKIKENKKLVIKFSDEIIKKDIGYISHNDIKNSILEGWKLNQEAKQMIEQINSREDVINLLDELAIEISNYNEIDYGDVYDTLSYFISISKNHHYIFATHDYIYNVITFYPNAISNFADSKISDEQIYEIAFIEELYHLFYRDLGEKNAANAENFCDSFYRHDYISKNVKESLTCYYSLSYCNKYGINKKMFKHVFEANPVIHPAAGVKFILDYNHYQKILNKSIINSDEALKSLYNNYRENGYDVINKDFYVNNIKTIYNTLDK